MATLEGRIYSLGVDALAEQERRIRRPPTPTVRTWLRGQGRAPYRELWRDDLTDQPAVDLALADMFEQRRNRNTKSVRRLERLLGLALVSLVIETGGLALAGALAS